MLIVVVPGPTIQANKGDTFNINVIDGLTDNTMLRSTSIVGILFY
jgi:iron transport multicopper oxidase